MLILILRSAYIYTDAKLQIVLQKIGSIF